MKTIKEGLARILVPEQPGKPKKSKAFYNERMKLNRDLSVLVAKEFFKRRKKTKVCEPLAATGVRALRYALELPNSEVYCGDIKRSAVENIMRNVEINHAKNIHVFHMRAQGLLAEREYDLVDLDPFGTPSSFIEHALTGLKQNGLLGVTATDVMALCGVRPKAGTKMPKYIGASALRTEYVHEIAVRLLLGLIARKSKNGIEPLLSLSREHYLRVFLKPRGSEAIGYLNHCYECGTRLLSKGKRKRCKCGSLYEHAGPLWTGNLWDKTFCEKLKAEDAKLQKILDFIAEEADGEPLFYTTRELYKGKQIPRMELVLEEHNATRTHFKPDGVRLR